MGKQIGLIYLSGQYGDVQLSMTADGKPVAKFAPQRGGKKVKTARNYGLTRENNHEFTGSAYGAKSLRMCFGERYRQFAEQHLTARLTGLMQRIIARGAGPGGRRSLEVLSNADMLRGVRLDRKAPLAGRLMSRYSVAVNGDRNTATVDLPSIHTDSYLRAPSGATHYKILVAAGVLSDQEHNGTTYEAVNPELDGVSVLVESSLLVATYVVNPPLQLVASIPGLPVLPITTALVVSLGIEWYRVINTFPELMASGNAMEVVAVL